jgi:4-carboxymuconolactone decarboxylase
MARLPRIPAADAGLSTKIAYLFTRRAMREMTGRAPRDMLEPLEVFANVPALMRGYGRLEQTAAKVRLLDERHRLLAELRAATMTECEYCIDIGSQVARRRGLSDEELLALAAYRDSPLFSEVDRLVLDYATGMSRTPVDVPDALFAALERRFDTPQLLELTFAIALENLRGRFNLALDIGAAGFSAGMVCAAPASAAGATPALRA